MKNYQIKSFSLIAVLLLLISLGCSSNYGGKTRVTVFLNLKNPVISRSDVPLIDRLLRLFSTEAKAQTAPTNLTSLTLKISGADMQDIINTYSATIPSSIDVEVPSGNARLFELTAQSNTYYFTGTASQDLETNIDATVPITMAIQYSTVTLTPDFGAAGTPSNITSYTVSASVSNSGATTTLLASTAYTLGSTVQIPAGLKRDVVVIANSPTFNYSGSATSQDILTSTAALPVTMATDYTNVAVTPTNTLGTPANITSFTVNVTTGGSAIFTTTAYTAGASILVPAGSARDVEILVGTTSATLRGTLTGQTLASGGSVNLNIPVSLYETKIIIPDYYFYNSTTFTFGRLVQIDDITGAGWIAKDITSLNLSPAGITSFRPYDVKFDSIGRIYIANYENTPSAAIIRLNHINDTNPVIVTTAATYIQAMAIDNINNFLYFTSSNTLYRIRTDIADTAQNQNLSGSELDVSNNFIAVAVDNTNPNQLYVVNSFAPSVFKLDMSLTPGFRRVLTSSASFSQPWDVIIKSSGIYVSNYGGPSVIQLDANLNQTAVLTQDPGTTAPFKGPHRFLAILNKKFYLIDDVDSMPNLGKLIGFDDMVSNWTFFDASMVGQSEFKFYGSC